MLCRCFDLDIDGEDVVRRKGFLYICKTYPQVKGTPHQDVRDYPLLTIQIVNGGSGSDEDFMKPKKPQLGVKVCSRMFGAVGPICPLM